MEIIGFDIGTGDMTCYQAMRACKVGDLDGWHILDTLFVEPGETFDVENERVS